MRHLAAGAACLAAWGWMCVSQGATETRQAETATAPAASSQTAKAGWDSALEAATRTVQSSDRYLHHSKLKRGMTGYGLTVLAGTEVARFQVEILSVMERWQPQQDVILARLSGANLERLGLAAGMSGSPVFVRDADGKDKLIGAVAYGFIGCKEPMCGIQPIAQMLAIGERTGQPEGDEADASGNEGASFPASCGDEWLKEALSGKEIGLSDVARLMQAKPLAGLTGGPALAPLATSVAISGLGPNAIAALGECLRPMGFLPVQAGAAGAEQRGEAMTAGLAPGAAFAIPLVTGDADFSAIGTVTEVSGRKVLALGHEVSAEGDVEFPIAPAYVHAVVPGLIQSFKLGSAAEVTGTLLRDQATGVSGLVGRKPSMVPMTVTVEWTDEGRSQHYEYNIIRHRMLTPIAAASLVLNTSENWRMLPPHHTVRHSVEIEFAGLGRFRAANSTSGRDVSSAASDLLRAIVPMLNTSLGPPARVERIDVRITIEPVDRSAEILELRPGGSVYQPGQKITGTVVLKPYRKERVSLPFEFALPEDLEDGTYTLTACDSRSALQQRMAEMPQRFAPRTVRELFESLGESVRMRGDCLYFRLPLRRGGLAVGSGELNDLPDSRLRIINESTKLDVHSFSQAKVEAVQTEQVPQGSASAEFQVRRKGGQIMTDQQRNP